MFNVTCSAKTLGGLDRGAGCSGAKGGGQEEGEDEGTTKAADVRWRLMIRGQKVGKRRGSIRKATLRRQVMVRDGMRPVPAQQGQVGTLKP